MPLNQYLFPFDSVERDRDDGIYHGSVRTAVIFAHTNEPIPHPIYGGISVPALGGLANRPGHPVFILPIKLLVGEIGEKDDSVVDKDSPTAVLVNPRTCVERSGCYIMIRAARAM